MNVLIVCTGNVCRSPVAQALLSNLLDDSVTVTSAGLNAPAHRSVAPLMAEMLAEDGIDSQHLTTQALTLQLVEQSELIIAMTRAQRAEVVGRSPAAVRRTFTLLEFRRLLAGASTNTASVALQATPDVVSDAARLRALLPQAIAQRASQAGRKHSDDVPDPVGRGKFVHARVYRQISRSVTDIATSLHTATVPRPATGVWAQPASA